MKAGNGLVGFVRCSQLFRCGQLRRRRRASFPGKDRVVFTDYETTSGCPSYAVRRQKHHSNMRCTPGRCVLATKRIRPPGDSMQVFEQIHLVGEFDTGIACGPSHLGRQAVAIRIPFRCCPHAGNRDDIQSRASTHSAIGRFARHRSLQPDKCRVANSVYSILLNIAV